MNKTDLLFFSGIVLINQSCNKENIESPTSVIETRSTTLTPEERVALFTPISQGTFDPNRTFTKEDAILGMETVLNYQYGDFTQACDDTYSLQDTITVAKQNGEITDPVVKQVYDEALKLMECHSTVVFGLNNVIGTYSSQSIGLIGPKTDTQKCT